MLGGWIDEWDEDGKEPEGSLQSIYANLFQIDLQDAGHVFSSQATENNELVCNKHIYIYIYFKKKKDKERRILRESRMEEDEEEVMKGDKNASGKDIYVSGHKITKER